MSETLTPPPNSVHLELAVWNILLDVKHGDHVAPQADRLLSIANTIKDLGKQFDVFTVLEAQQTEDQHNGEELAKLTGYEPGTWQSHSRPKHGERIGMFGNRVDVDNVETIKLPPGKKAIITKVGPIAIAGTHLKYQLKGPERANQATKLMERMADEEYGVIMLDANSLFWQKPRRIIEEAGYRSAFKLLEKPKLRPRTIHTVKHYHQHMPFITRSMIPGGLSVDDIYVKNIPVLDAYPFEGDSDHRGLGVTLDATGILKS